MLRSGFCYDNTKLLIPHDTRSEMAQTLFKFFPQNRYGRDFVVGDIHGCFSLLETLLEKVNFQALSDRIFSVGDLIDRGDESSRILQFIQQPWFHCIMGNHERMLLDSKTDPMTRRNWVQYNGGDWWEFISITEQADIEHQISQLPLVFEVATKLGRVGIVHADVPEEMSWKSFIQSLHDNRKTREHVLWSRNRYHNLTHSGNTSSIEGIDWVVCGHTPIEKPRLAANIHYIDTGAVFDREPGMGNLTLLQIHPQQEIFQTEKAELTAMH